MFHQLDAHEFNQTKPSVITVKDWPLVANDHTAYCTLIRNMDQYVIKLNVLTCDWGHRHNQTLVLLIVLKWQSNKWTRKESVRQVITYFNDKNTEVFLC